MAGDDVRYKAFVSYSSRDRAAGRRLFRRLEAYRVPKPLVQAGHPKRLRPLFRDREELAAGGDLNAKINAALGASEWLIVLGSPNAAASPWVNREIIRFKASGRSDRIIPVILSGEPQDAFPPALSRQVTSDGEVTDAPDDIPLGADLRPDGDGPRGGLLKIVSGLLGVGFDELRRREEAAARRRALMAYGLAGLFALMTVTAAGALWVALDRNERLQAAFISLVENIAGGLDETIALYERGRLTTEETGRELARVRTLVETAFALAPENPRLLAEEAKLQLMFARHYGRIGNTDAAATAAARADAILVRIGRDDSTLRLRSIALDEKADLDLRLGDVAAARAGYAEGLRIRRDLAARDKGNLQYQRDVSVSLNKLADLDLRSGDVAAARAGYAEGLEIARDLAARDKGNLDYQRDLAVSFVKLSQVDEGNAAAHLRAARDQLRRLKAAGYLSADDAPLLEELERLTAGAD